MLRTAEFAVCKCKVEIANYLVKTKGAMRIQHLMQFLKTKLGADRLPHEKVVGTYLKNVRLRGGEAR